MRNNLWIGSGISGMGGIPMLGTGARGLTSLIKGIFRNNEQGFAYDPNDLSTLYQDVGGIAPVTAAGQPVGLMFDKSKGLVYKNVLAQQDTFSFYGSGAIPPTATSSSAEFLNKACVSVTFPAIGTGGYTISRAQGAQHAITSGKFYKYTYKIALSRKLTAGERIQVYATGSNGTSETILTNGTQDNTWLDCSSQALVGVSGSNNFTIFALQTNAPVTVYATAFSLSTLDIGNHAYQTVSASRPILQQTPILGGELLVNGDGSDGVSSWVTSASTLTNNAGVFTLTAAGQFGKVTNNVNLVVGKTYRLSIDVVSNTANATVSVIARKQTAAENYGVIQITSAKQYSFLFTPTEASTRIIVEHGAATPTGSIVFDNVSVTEFQGYSTDQNYLKFDGVDDFLVTNSIDFTATDKVSLFAGVRISSQVPPLNYQVVVELSADNESNNGAFVLTTPHGVFGAAQYSSRGTTRGNNVFSGITTEQRVISAQSSISSDVNKLKVNGSLQSLSSDQGTGNYGNYPLYIGRRGGTSLPFNGHLYSLIGIGRLTTDSETIALEKVIAKNTGVTLNV